MAFKKYKYTLHAVQFNWFYILLCETTSLHDEQMIAVICCLWNKWCDQVSNIPLCLDRQ